MLGILGVKGEAIAGADGVVVLAAVLAIIGAVLLVPWLGVERAVGSIRDVVDGQEIGIEEIASIICAIRARVAVVVSGCSCAGSSTLSGIVDAGKILHTDIGVLACSIERSVDGTTELSGSVKAGNGVRGVVLGVAVGASDDDVELITVLALVDCSFGGDTRAPESAFDVGEGGWIRASGTWIDGGVTLEVDVKGSAEVGGIAELLAFDSVVGLEGGETHVAVGVDRCLQVHEGPLVALWGWCVGGDIL